MIMFNGQLFNDEDGEEGFDQFLDAMRKHIEVMLTSGPKKDEPKFIDSCEMFDKANKKKFVIKLYLDKNNEYRFTRETMDDIPAEEKRINEINTLLKLALETEDYLKAANLKRELDELIKNKSDDNDSSKTE